MAERRRARHFPKLETTREQRRQSSLDRALAPVRGAGIIVDVSYHNRPSTTLVLNLLKCTLRFASVLEKMNIVRTPSKSIAYPPIPLVSDFRHSSCQRSFHSGCREVIDKSAQAHYACCRRREETRSIQCKWVLFGLSSSLFCPNLRRYRLHGLR